LSSGRNGPEKQRQSSLILADIRSFEAPFRVWAARFIGTDHHNTLMRK
jgi:hypothetical protein